VWLCNYGLNCRKDDLCEASCMHKSLASSNSRNFAVHLTQGATFCTDYNTAQMCSMLQSILAV